MTRIKKRRSGKNKTSDALRTAAGRRRARSADKAAAAPKEGVAAETVVNKTTAPKKKYVAPKGGRRGNRSVEKATPFKGTRATNDKAVEKQTPFKKQLAPVKPAAKTGKTRSAGARRVAVSRSVANTFKKNTGAKKAAPAAKDEAAPKKQGKGFAPWNKNKFKKK